MTQFLFGPLRVRVSTVNRLTVGGYLRLVILLSVIINGGIYCIFDMRELIP